MPRGGYRPGAGRKPRAPRPDDVKTLSPAILTEAARENLTPLAYMLRVLNDPTADDGRRDRMAQAAAPYVHQRASDMAPGKKEQREQAARKAERGTDWESLLQ